jgi:AraC family transcriptional regulator
MKPILKTIPEKKFIGQKTTMSLSSDKTQELWKKFMPRRNEVKNQIGIELYSFEIYPKNYFERFSPIYDFVKWAAVQVTDFIDIPQGMESLTVNKGLYAIFLYKGPAKKAFKIYHYIYQSWIPNSTYMLDQRPHIAVMGKKYSNEDFNSEEEICIPIKKIH